MEKEGKLNKSIEYHSQEFLKETESKEIYLISHFDTDGITSASIMIKALQRLDRKFTVKILKNLTEEFLETIPEDKIILFLDLASGSLETLSKKQQEFFIIDHHEIPGEIPSNVKIVNPQLHDKEKISSSGLTYLFCKNFDEENSDLAKLAVLGMIGDRLEGEIDKLNNNILREGEIKKKRGLLIYPSTRPINRTLEFCSNPYIPGVTGNVQGVRELLRECEINPSSKKGYKTLLELEDDEMEKLVTAITLRNPKAKNEKIIGDIFLLKIYNKLEDARELSAKINACSRLGETETAILFCLEDPKAQKRVDSIHIKYKQHIISGLNYVEESEKIEGKDFMIINAKENIKDTIVGTIASILSSSPKYSEGTTIVTMAYSENKIKVSARNVGSEGRNVRSVLSRAVDIIGGEVGGHEFAAGCMVSKEKEEEFISNLKKELEVEMIRV